MPYELAYCRACLKEPEPFSYSLDDPDCLEMYCFCTSIEIKQDEIARYLCVSCYKLMSKFSKFKEQCVRTEEILQTAYAVHPTIKSENVKENDVKLKKEIEKNISKGREENIRVKKEEFTESDDSERNYTVNIVIYDDPVSPVTSPNKPTKNKKKLPKLVLKSSRLKKKFSYACGLCNKKFGFKERFEAHMLEHEGKSKPIYCTPCNKTFTTWGGLKRHNDCEHTVLSAEQLTCKFCSKVFKSPRTLKIHYATHGDRKLKICDVCGRGFKSHLTLKAHLETHIENRERRYSCQHCDKKYLSKKTCASHTSRRHSDKRYICHHCDYPFTDKSTLSKHILIHEGKKQLYKCDLCLKTYSSQSALVTHKRIHTGERPFICNYCPKSFSNRRMLVDHQRIHTGEKPHKCSVCEQSFTQRGTMKRHMKVHDRICT